MIVTVVQTEEEKSRLHCYYETKKHPYLKIAPNKVELLNEYPRVVQIYDILGPHTIEAVIKKAAPSLTRSLVVNVKDPKVEPCLLIIALLITLVCDSQLSDVSDVRTSMQTWIYDGDHRHAEFLDRISRQIEYITGLNVRNLRGGRAAEAYQIASYRTSHHYDEHLDAVRCT